MFILLSYAYYNKYVTFFLFLFFFSNLNPIKSRQNLSKENKFLQRFISKVHLKVSAYVRKKVLNPGRKTECTQFEIRFSTCNGGSMSEKWGEISETLKRRCVDICCLQEVRWKGQGAKVIGNSFKFLWSSACKAWA